MGVLIDISDEFAMAQARNSMHRIMAETDRLSEEVIRVGERTERKRQSVEQQLRAFEDACLGRPCDTET